MGKMHAPGKGMSSSALPFVRKAPNWLRMSKDDIVDAIVKLSKKGFRPSAIGVQIRDQYGVSQSVRHRKQDPPRAQGAGHPARPAGGPLLLDQEGRHHAQASRAQPQGQARQVPPHSRRVANPPSRAILQDAERHRAYLEVRLRHRLCPRRIKQAEEGKIKSSRLDLNKIELKR